MSLQNNKFAIQTALRIRAREESDRMKIEIDDEDLDRRVAEWRGVLEARKYQWSNRRD